ncbi:MAG: hypothetical protein HUN04_11210 [Desulfobacter sp.]|nr:MAG: hypothetical protein HUN04_11210 [Desulfobacter sp.]
MEKEQFEELFKDIIIKPLQSIGFKTAGKSIFYDDGNVNVSLIRLGGRMSTLGSISHMLCFRHSYLPNLNEKIPTKFEPEVFSYPFKFKPSFITTAKPKKWIYKCQNLNYDYERYDFSNVSDNKANTYLTEICDAIVNFLKWAKKIEPKAIVSQIKQNGEMAWIERAWMDAYFERRAF